MKKNLFSKITSLVGAGIFSLFFLFPSFAETSSLEKRLENKISKIENYVKEKGNESKGLYTLEIPLKNGNCMIFIGDHPWAKGKESIQIIYEKTEYNYTYKVNIFDQNKDGIKGGSDSFESKINERGPYESITFPEEDSFSSFEEGVNYIISPICWEEKIEDYLIKSNTEYEKICDEIINTI